MEYLITIEGGHGMDTAGKETPKFPDGRQMKENEFNDKVVAYFKAMFAFTPNVEVYDCAPEVGDTALATRVSRANAKYNEYKQKYGIGNFNAIHISIHANAYLGTWGVWGGQGVFYNTGSVNGQKLATTILSELLKGTPLRNRGITAASFYMVKYTVAPAALIEAAFMDNLEEAKLLISDSFRRETAQEVALGAANYLGFKIVPKPVEQPAEQIKVELPLPGEQYLRVVVGSFKLRSSAEDMRVRLKAAGFTSFLALYNKE